MSIIYFPLVLAYPLYKTAEIIQKPRLAKAKNWLIYWEIFGLLMLIEPITSWIPFSTPIQFMVLLGLCVMSGARGAHVTSLNFFHSNDFNTCEASTPDKMMPLRIEAR